MRRFFIGILTVILLLFLALAIRYAKNIHIPSIVKKSQQEKLPLTSPVKLPPSPTKEAVHTVSLDGTFLCLPGELHLPADEKCPPGIQQGNKRYALNMTNQKNTWFFYEGESIHIEGILTPTWLLKEEMWQNASLSGRIEVQKAASLEDTSN